MQENSQQLLTPDFLTYLKLKQYGVKNAQIESGTRLKKYLIFSYKYNKMFIPYEILNNILYMNDILLINERIYEVNLKNLHIIKIFQLLAYFDYLCDKLLLQNYKSIKL